MKREMKRVAGLPLPLYLALLGLLFLALWRSLRSGSFPRAAWAYSIALFSKRAS